MHPSRLYSWAHAYVLQSLGGRKEQALAQFPDEAPGIEYLAEQDPSGSQKYLGWGAQQLYEQGPEVTARLIERFHSAANEGRIAADIYSFPDATSLGKALDHAEEKLTKGDVAEVRTQGMEKMGEIGPFTMYEVFSSLAAVCLGKGTRWCISAVNKNFFNTYFPFHFIFVLIPADPGVQGKLALLVNRNTRKVQLFNAQDRLISPHILPAEVLAAVEKKAPNLQLPDRDERFHIDWDEETEPGRAPKTDAERRKAWREFLLDTNLYGFRDNKEVKDSAATERMGRELFDTWEEEDNARLEEALDIAFAEDGTSPFFLDFMNDRMTEQQVRRIAHRLDPLTWDSDFYDHRPHVRKAAAQAILAHPLPRPYDFSEKATVGDLILDSGLPLTNDEGRRAIGFLTGSGQYRGQAGLSRTALAKLEAHSPMVAEAFIASRMAPGWSHAPWAKGAPEVPGLAATKRWQKEPLDPLMVKAAVLDNGGDVFGVRPDLATPEYLNFWKKPVEDATVALTRGDREKAANVLRAFLRRIRQVPSSGPSFVAGLLGKGGVPGHWARRLLSTLQPEDRRWAVNEARREQSQLPEHWPEKAPKAAS